MSGKSLTPYLDSVVDRLNNRCVAETFGTRQRCKNRAEFDGKWCATHWRLQLRGRKVHEA